MTDVSILGTGLMGAAMARVLLRNGYSVTVWNRSPAKASHLKREGAVIASSATEAITASPLVFFVILSYDNVRALLTDALEHRDIGDVVNVVTGSPTEADELEAWTRENGITLLDGALLTYPKGIGRDDTVVLYSGDEGAWRRNETMLRGLAGGSQYLGHQARLANAVDHVSLSFVSIVQTAMLSTLAYAQVLGVPREQAVARMHRSLTNMKGYLDYALPMVDSGDFSATESTIDTWALSTRDFARGWRDAGLSGKAIAAAAETVRGAQEAGLGQFDLAAVYQFELGQADSSS
ncbi:NAD(P)-dependent oxidoreductase [Nocardioides eburneiflavus]|uniref:NAD(P)-dependent oxidoreductase n=1 Tax=Nocardioides eburneiflavus TaxID=2518372 RepID=A0A4Z1CHG4_9ACTN|nr:FAD-dependent oxidoreductase [Nocardioides eburneiflavus]TGN65047.1 NAD(P)-dependent oxidoreductase [Nocardioides eburneiflavus]